MIRLKRIYCSKDPEYFTESISYVNQLRATYQWSQKVYDQTNTDNVLLIQSGNQIVGFVEVELRNTRLTDREQIEIYVWHLQFAPSVQRSGYATKVLEMLLEKGVDLEFVIANCNEAARALCQKFDHQVKYKTEKTATIRIPARGPSPNKGFNRTPVSSGPAKPGEFGGGAG